MTSTPAPSRSPGHLGRGHSNPPAPFPHRLELIIRDAAICTMYDLGLSKWFIAQFFGYRYTQVSSFVNQHHRRVYRGRLCQQR